MLRLLVRSRRGLSSTARPLSSENFYALLGVSEAFDISAATLSSRFKDLQRQWHPDRFGRSPPAERERASAMSARINEAYATLREPGSRARHLLTIRGEEDDTQHPLDPEFLHWVVETREEVAATRGDEERLKSLKKDAGEAMRECLSALAHAFESGDLSRAATETAKLQYLRRIEASIAGAEDGSGES